MTTAVKRACDACHRRKVKCDGINPCRNCSASQLSCTYNAVPQKKGPKGSRAKVISELRETQRQTSLSAKVQNRMAGINSPPSTPSLAPTPGLLTSELIKDCMEFFFTNMYPSMPILNRHRLEQQAATDQGLDTYCLLTSFCGFMMLQPGMSMPAIPGETYNFDVMPGANIVTATLLLEETLRVRKGYDWLESPTLNTLCTNYFLFGCYYGLDFHDKAWFYLREATTMTHMFGMTKEETYIQSDSTESARRRRLYWLLYVTERAYALQRLRPVTLQATVNLPTAADDPMDPLAHQLGGFVLLVSLFRHFDDAFITLWNKTRGECSPAYIASLQKQLMEVLPQYRNSQDSQLGELQINQQWLKNMQCLASGNAGDMYSIDIGRDLLPMVDHLPGGLGLHGLGLLCGLSDAVVEYLSIQPASRDPFSVGPREHLQQILNIVTMLRQGDHRFLPLLLNKVNDILPRLANPMLQNPPENACNIDIFDGFGNAGMAQPPLFQADEYDNKFAITRIDDLNNDSGSSGGSTVKNDMNSPFVSSPPLMSPGMELRHGLAGDFNPIPDMVMSPMGGNVGSMNTPPSIHNQQLQHQQHQQHQQHHQHHQHQHHHPPQQQQQHHQPHQQHHILSGFQNLNPQLNLNQNPTMSMANQGLPQGLNLTQGLPNIGHGLGNGLTSPLGQGMNVTNIMARQAPQRTNSFAMGPAQIRTVGDFHALQRANSDLNTMSSLGISNMGTEMDFNTLPR